MLSTSLVSCLPLLGHTLGLVYTVTLARAVAVALVHAHTDTHAGVLRLKLVLQITLLNL